MDTSKLIVIRGNSGSGKTTLSQKLLQLIPNSTLVEQDYFIKYTASSKTAAQEAARKTKIFTTVKSALAKNEIVILEGVFDSRRYSDYFSNLVAEHANNNYFFYIDLTFDETLKRHALRDKRHEFGEEAMSNWYIAHDQLGYGFETTIGPDIAVDAAINLILKTIGH